ncbi:hypothetical protein JCM10213_001553 [Rhodosporidiobolus nylandii]
MPSLLDLPAELLDIIVDLVHASRPKQYLGAVHRAFHPRARRLTFREVEVSSYGDLSLLCDIVKGSAAVGGTVKDVVIELEGENDNGDPKPAVVSALFRQLCSVEQLSVKGSTRLAKAVLTPSRRPYPFPSLRSLVIEDPLTGWSNPFSPHHYLELTKYLLIDSLTLHVVKRPPTSIGRHKPCDTELVGGVSWWLDLKGPLAADPAALELVEYFDNIDGLRLDVKDAPPDFRIVPFFERLRDSDALTVLSLSSVEYPTADIFTILSTFPNLENVEFVPPVPFAPLLPALCGLPHLRRLFALAGNPVPTADLKQLVTGSTKPPSLERIALNTLWYCGNGCCEYGWTPDFRLEGLIEVLGLASASGIELTGGAAAQAQLVIEGRKQVAEAL